MASRKSYLVIIVPIHMKIWPQVNIGQVGVGLKIAQIHLSGPQRVIILQQLYMLNIGFQCTQIATNHPLI